MCKLLYGTEATVNMDNYYMPTATAIKLRDDKVLCRGTIHLTQCCYHKVFYSCQQKPSSPPRGHSLCAVNKENNLITIGWLDNKPFNFLSTADTTENAQVMRRIRNEKVLIPAPVTVA